MAGVLVPVFTGNGAAVEVASGMIAVDDTDELLSPSCAAAARLNSPEVCCMEEVSAR